MKGNNMTLTLKILIEILLIIFGNLLTLMEISVVSASETDLSSGKGKRIKRITRLRKNTKSYLGSLRFAMTFNDIATGACAVLFFSGYLSGAFSKISFTGLLADFVSVLITLAVTALVVCIVGEYIPKYIAIKYPLQIAKALGSLATAVYFVFLPFSKASAIAAAPFLKIFDVTPAEEGVSITEEEIKILVEAGSEKGTIDSEEKEFIENVFAFDDLTANDIATHRTGITLLWTSESPEEWEKTILKSSHTFFPVCDEKIDNVVGVLNSKDYFRLKNRSLENIKRHAITQPYFVPETMKANSLFRNMKQKRIYFAVVIDEYGGMSGIVTINDLLECIVGDIYDDPAVNRLPDIEPLDSKKWLIRGSAPVEDVEKALGVRLEGDFDTFAGYVLTMLSSIPEDGSTLMVENEIMTVRITSVTDHRIEKTMVSLKDIPGETEDD